MTRFSRLALPTPLRPYQLAVAEAICRSVIRQAGLTITVIFPRQAGKNQTSAAVQAFLLLRHSRIGGSLVKSAPTFKPQLLTSIDRLQRLLDGPLTRRSWRRTAGQRLELGAATCTFLSAHPQASILGATASLLLEADEAQDVEPDRWDRDLVPMAATGNATRVLWGTPWTDDTLLAREVARNRELQRRDGIQRHFQVSWEQVAAHLPAYRAHVEAEIARLGEHHPIIRTQYLPEPLARADRLLSADQLDRLLGDHPPLDHPAQLPRHWARGHFVAGLDAAGADEDDPDTLLTRPNPARDLTALTIAYAEQVVVEPHPPSLSTLSPPPSTLTPGVLEPRLHVVRQYAWRGDPHRQLYPTILALVRDRWRCRAVVVDATGVGSGLAAFLGAALGDRVVTPYTYTAASKSKLAYDLLAALNANRLKLHTPSPDPTPPPSTLHPLPSPDDLLRELLHQAAAARYTLRANQTLRWHVPERDGHDDLLNALALLVQAAPLTPRRIAIGHPAPP